MKKTALTILLLSLIAFTSCGVEDVTTDLDITNDSDLGGGDEDPNEVVVFPDPGLDKCVREEILMPKPEGDLTFEEIQTANPLDCTGYGIESLEGIEKIKNLSIARLANNKIKDVTPLGKCVNLSDLELDKNEIEDASPLSSLVNLTRLNIAYNSISDISYVKNLTQLKTFYTGENPISDISPVSSLTNLTGLYLNDNRVSSISEIKGLLNLVTISVGENCITDFSPIDYLKENGKLTTVNGDSVSDQDYDKCQ